MSRSEWKQEGEVRAETGIFTHEGREFPSGGAFVSPTHAIGYPHFPGADRIVGTCGEMRGWDGQRLGTCRVVARWHIQSWVGSYMHQIEATIDGRTYTGRGMGEGMIWRGRVKASK